MLDFSGYATFAQEPRRDVCRVGDFRVDQLDGDLFAEHDVRCAENRPHPALTDKRIEPVLAIDQFANLLVMKSARQFEDGTVRRAHMLKVGKVSRTDWTSLHPEATIKWKWNFR
jgi:hypothetical protein